MSNCEENFCTDYLVLKHEEATLIDLFGVLFSPDLEKRASVDCPKGKSIRTFDRRWLIFISLVVQKILFFLKTPMAATGSELEKGLNLLSSNGGFMKLLLNLLTRKAVWPKESSATFTSVIGNLDKRVELDKRIKHGDCRYNASLSIMAAKLSYENEAFVKTVVRDHWKMDFLGYKPFYNEYQKKSSTQTIMFRDTSSDPDLIVVAFRGTRPFDSEAWRTDVDISWYELGHLGKVHGGFMKALGLQKSKGWPKDIQPGSQSFAYYKIRQELKEILEKNERAKFIITGHSLGGALAILFVAILALHEEAWLMQKLEGVYTFGQPRVGDRQFGEFMKEKLKVHDVKYFRYVYCNDMVARVPYDDKTLLFKHFGPCLYYNSFYKGKEVWEEPNKNYFSILWLIPKNLNAVWELTRSFIIPYIKGPEYKEGWFMRMLRLIGLAIPGLSAHSPQEYVNITRLGSTLPLTLHVQDPIREQEFKFD